MELFNEVKNRYFQLVFRIINECAGGKAQDEILRIIDEGEFEQKVLDRNQKTFADLILNKGFAEDNLNLLQERDHLFWPVIAHKERSPLPVRYTKIEKEWLKALLEEPGVRLILSKETWEKLKNELNDVDTPIRNEYIEMTNIIKLPDVMEYENFEKNFRLLLEALMQGKAIRYSNTDKKGNLYQDRRALPVSIEYSMRDKRFRVSMYSLDDQRPIMANIFTMSDLKIVDEKLDIDRESAKRILYEQKSSPEPVILEVIDKKAAMERCFMCFSGMERTAKCLGEEKYEIRLNYYLFEEENLIRSIISLGPYVKVISPQRIADEIVKRVKKSLEFATG